MMRLSPQQSWRSATIFIMKFPEGYKIMLFYENEVFSLPPLAKMDKA